MVKKLANSIKKRSNDLVSRLKKPKKVVYYANPRLHIPHDIVMPAQSFYQKIEKHLRTEATIVPILKEPLTWKKFVRYNPGFKKVRIDIITHEGRNYPDKAWDMVVRHIVNILKKNHKIVD